MKIIKKFWGVALVLVLLSTMFLSAAPVSAGTLSFTASVLPSDRFVGITSAGTVINDFAISADGMTIYVAGINTGLPVSLKSVNGGLSWFPIVPALAATDMVAVAPDNPNFVVFVDTGTPEVTVSTNGGTTFSTLGAPQDLAAAPATTVASVDVSKTVAGVNYIAIGGTIAAVSGLFYFDKGASIPKWRNAVTDLPILGAGYTWVTGTVFSAVKFSPNFDIDGIAYLVESDLVATTARLHVVSFMENQFNAGIGAYPLWAATGTVINAAITAALTKADIAFDPLYSIDEGTLRTAYVSLYYAALGGVYRFTDNVNSGAIAGSVATWSIAVNGTGTVLVAGAALSNAVYTNTAPTSIFGSFVPNRQVKRPGVTGVTDFVQVGWSGANVVMSKQGASGAFSVSTDNGLTFNDISLVNAAMTFIQDTVVSADGTKRYVVSSDATPATSIFYWDGTAWQRTYAIGNANAHIAKASPTNFNVLYMGDTTNKALVYTNSAGKTNWLGRTAPGPAANTIVDLEVEADSTLYVATNGATDVVGKSTFYGLTWVPGSVLTPALFAATGIASITLVSANNLIAGGNAGETAYTTDGGMSWIPLGGIAGGASIYTAAASLATGSNIYAVNSADTDVYTWTLGTSLAWTSPGLAIGAFAVVGTATYLSTGIALTNGTLYRFGAVAGTDTEISRTLDPFFGPFATWANTSPAAALGIATADVVPDVVKVSTGNQLWFIDSTNGVLLTDRILTYTDSLAAPGTAPVLTAPADASLVQVNNLTGIAYDITLGWNAISVATGYQVDVALDSAFVNRVIVNGPMVFPAVIPGLPVIRTIGPGQAGVWLLNFMPGQQYFWRVRANTPFFSAYSPTWSFTIMPGQALVADLSSPANGGTINTTNPSFSWTPLGGITSYDFQLDTGTSFTAPLYSGTANGGGLDLPVTIVLERGRTYFWRVKALTPTMGDWSTIGNFTVAALEATSTTTSTTTTTTVTNTTITIPPATSTIITVPAATQTVEEVNPTYIWAIIIIGAVLVLAVIVLIVRTRRSV